MRTDWAYQCGLKRAFASQQDAEAFFRSRRRKWKGGRNIHSYRCGHCRMWHLGHYARRSAA